MQSFRVKLVLKCCIHLSNSEMINTFTTFTGVKVILFYLKQLSLNSALILELFTHINFGERLWFAVIGVLIFSFDIPLDSHFMIISVKIAGVFKCFVNLKNWKIKEFYNPSLSKKLWPVKRHYFVCIFYILFCYAFNSAFAANVVIFLSKSVLFINPEILDSSTHSFSFIFAPSISCVNLL